MWFYHILRRTDTMSEPDKQIIKDVLKMQYNYAELVKDDPIIQNLLTDIRLEGESQGLRKSVLSILNARFPILAAASQTQQAVASIQEIGKLEMLLEALLHVSDEHVARATYSGRSALMYREL
jgi:hypothetical protein